MYSNNRTIFRSMIFGAFFASIVSFMMYRRNRHMSMMEMPMIGLKKGGRMIRSGTRSAMRSAKHGLKVMAR